MKRNRDYLTMSELETKARSWGCLVARAQRLIIAADYDAALGPLQTFFCDYYANTTEMDWHADARVDEALIRHMCVNADTLVLEMTRLLANYKRTSKLPKPFISNHPIHVLLAALDENE